MGLGTHGCRDMGLGDVGLRDVGRQDMGLGTRGCEDMINKQPLNFENCDFLSILQNPFIYT